MAQASYVVAPVTDYRRQAREASVAVATMPDCARPYPLERFSDADLEAAAVRLERMAEERRAVVRRRRTYRALGLA